MVVLLGATGCQQEETRLDVDTKDLGPEDLVPADALAVLTIPDYATSKEAFLREPVLRMFTDSSMAPFLEDIQLMMKIEEGMDWMDSMTVGELTGMLHGQMTLAFFLEGNSFENLPPGILLLVEFGDHVDELDSLIDDIVDLSGSDRTITIRGNDFRIDGGLHTIFGRVGSLLVIAQEERLVEGVMDAILGVSSDSLSSHDVFHRVHADQFADAHAYAWFDYPRLHRLVRTGMASMDQEAALNPMVPVSPSKILDDLGLGAIEGIGVAYTVGESGSMVDAFLAVPQEKRAGIFDWIARAEGDVLPPETVPADVLGFSRIRVDIRESIRNVNLALQEMAPALIPTLSQMMGGTNGPAKDLQTNLFDRLGDDIITLTLPPQSLGDMSKLPTLYLISSPQPAELLRFLIDASENPALATMGIMVEKREIGGRTVHVIGHSSMGTNLFTLYITADDSHLMVATEEGILADHLRGSLSESSQSLRDREGMAEAVRALGSDSLINFNYFNLSLFVADPWDGLRRSTDSISGFNSSGPGMDPFQAMTPEQVLSQIPLDFTLLPPFAEVARYFNFQVSGASSNSGYISYRFYTPFSPDLD